MAASLFQRRPSRTITPSATGAEAAEQERNQISLPTNYNLKLGPVLVTASAGFGLEFNDNIDLSDNHREADLILRPSIEFDSTWQATPANVLHLTLGGVGYAIYTNHSEFDSNSILVDPGTALSFDVFVGDNLRLNFHDNLSIVQNPIDEPDLSNVVKFDRLENSAGLSATLDFNQLGFVFGYDHLSYESIGNSDFYILDHQEEQVFASASLKISDAILTGVDGSFGHITYSKDYNNDGDEYSIGPFLEMTLFALLQNPHHGRVPEHGVRRQRHQRRYRELRRFLWQYHHRPAPERVLEPFVDPRPRGPARSHDEFYRVYLCPI